MKNKLLEVSDLRVRIGSGETAVEPVAGVSFVIHSGETFALLGESGCGKSMTALALLGLLPDPRTGVTTGSVKLGGEELLSLPERALRAVRGARIAMIFQDPMSSLNPVMRVGAQVAESVRQHQGLRGAALRQQVLELLRAVGLAQVERRCEDYPHQLSGGMKQRVMIAMALAGDPQLLIADEPTTALDVTLQAQVLELIARLQKERGMAVLLITHDLGVVAGLADRIAVMYAGQLVEQAPRQVFMRRPGHPYSRKLFAALPAADKRARPLSVISGSVPALDGVFLACRFAARCDQAWEICRTQAPGWYPCAGNQTVRCHLADPRRSVSQHTRESLAETPINASYLRRAVSISYLRRPVSTFFKPLDSGLRRNDGEGFNQRFLGEIPAPGDALETPAPLLVVQDLKVYFPVQRGLRKRGQPQVKAVDGLSLSIPRGRTLALVGESGCGKTTAGKSILQLPPPSAGEVLFENQPLGALRGEALRRRRRDFQMIFQDAAAAMNPRLRVGAIIEEGMRAQGIGGDAAHRRRRVEILLEQVGLRAEQRLRYPHEFSGGQRQRIGIARALAVEPKLLVCDEPTSALDVSVQAQILNLLRDLQKNLALSYLFISHDISVVSYLAHRVAVMYLGRIVEQGDVDEVLDRPQHPYTQALLSAVPALDERAGRSVIRLQGDMPSAAAPPTGCHFHPRCRQAMPVCRRHYPVFSDQSPTHQVRCHLYSSP